MTNCFVQVVRNVEISSSFIEVWTEDHDMLNGYVFVACWEIKVYMMFIFFFYKGLKFDEIFKLFVDIYKML